MESRVPTTTSFASMPVTMPIVAGQFSSCMPSGANTGVMLWATARSTDLSLSLLPKEPSVPMLLSRFSANTMITITLPASRMNSLTRSQVRSATPLAVGRW